MNHIGRQVKNQKKLAPNGAHKIPEVYPGSIPGGIKCSVQKFPAGRMERDIQSGYHLDISLCRMVHG